MCPEQRGGAGRRAAPHGVRPHQGSGWWARPARVHPAPTACTLPASGAHKVGGKLAAGLASALHLARGGRDHQARRHQVGLDAGVGSGACSAQQRPGTQRQPVSSRAAVPCWAPGRLAGQAWQANGPATFAGIGGQVVKWLPAARLAKGKHQRPALYRLAGSRGQRRTAISKSVVCCGEWRGWGTPPQPPPHRLPPAAAAGSRCG